jgi:ribosomal protein L37E
MYSVNGWDQIVDQISGETISVCSRCGQEEFCQTEYCSRCYPIKKEDNKNKK